MTNTDTGSNPAGCILAFNPSDGALDKVNDMYCLPRAKGNLDFLATAPLMVLDARGPGLHTVFAADFNCTIYAFDPRALSAGPLYTFTPIPVDEPATVVSDYLTMSDGGALLLSTWNDETAAFTILAVPNPTNPFPANAPAPSTGMSPGGAAALSLFLIAGVAVGVATYMGKLPMVAKALVALKDAAVDGVGKLVTVSKGAGGYGKVPTTTASSFTSSSGGGGYGSSAGAAPSFAGAASGGGGYNSI